MSDMSSSNSPLVVGLTGGIGCGKSTVVSAFAQRGIPAFVADAQAASYYDEPDFVDAVCQALQADVRRDGHVDKRAIASLVFADPARLAALNGLVHPRVRRDFRRWLAAQTSPYVLFESAILYEYGLERDVDCVVCVYLEREERIRRLLLRDATSRDAIEARMANQLSAEEKMDRADFVLLNFEGNPRERQVAWLHDQLLARARARLVT
ncbi:MAG: dephospho-CoA kinase [Bacteroidales bacterium]|nr:dephospho-CoA kinase [Bacteroidales bacterium]